MCVCVSECAINKTVSVSVTDISHKVQDTIPALLHSLKLRALLLFIFLRH